MQDNIYNPDYVRGLFNRMSGSYERVNFITSFGFSIRWRTQFLDAFEPIEHRAEIIDLMTGMGETWRATKNKLPNSKLTVLDFSEGMLKYAKQKSEAQFNDEIIVLQQDVLKNNLESNHYDFVTSAFGLKTFNNEQLKILALETKRILKQGGQFAFIEVSKPTNILLRAFYSFYLSKMIPIIGRVLLGNPVEYRMLWQYTNKFDNAKVAAKIFEEAGLETHFRSYFLGCATGFYGKRVD